MTYRNASDPGPTATIDNVMREHMTVETAPSQASIAKVQTGFRKFSLSRRKAVNGPEDTWGPYGLHLLYDPPDALIDLIFVHGLRGGSIKTWCKNEDLKYFWPQAWLPREQDLQNARIHSFGYNADWADTKETALDLHDFGRALLAEMSTSPYLRRAKETPILLVGHSMGGIVMKKAYILAQQDPRDHGLADRMRCMFFLATPHRGSDSAKLLNNILRASTVLSSRQYISDIFKGSPSLQIINDEFRAFTDKVQIWSFYETLKTKTSATSSVLIVERDSAVLGYKGEMAQPLNADHRSICKFDSPADPNYITIKNTLSKAVEDLLGDVFLRRAEETKAQLGSLEAFLMILDNAEDDLIAVESNKTDGTCEWAVTMESFANWRDVGDEEPLFYWLTGEPGSGKSVVATHLIRNLQEMGADVCFHFFHHGRKTQQSVAGFLRQIAYQMAILHLSVRQSLYIMQEMGVAFDKDDERAIWRKLFMNEIFKMPLQKPQYWIIDGLDECVDSSKLFGLISKFDSAFPIRFYFVTRRRTDFDRHFNRLEQRLFTHHIKSDQSLEDIRSYIRSHATMLPVDEEESGSLIDRIVKKSKGIFLWAKLALEELENVYSDESVDDILNEMPEGMVSIYGRILEMMARNTREIKLTKAILTWVICGARSLTIHELQASLKLDLATHIRSVERSIDGLCGQLLRIDQVGTVQVIHTTVRDFLLDHGLDSPLAIQKDKGHQRLAVVCLRYLVSDEMRPPRNRSLVQVRSDTISAFAEYACTSFSDHVVGASAQSDEILLLLCQFFRTNVLSWIEYIARHKRDLYYITQTARNLRNYLERRAKYTSPLGDHYRIVEQWTSDLIRIVAKFARNILRFPSAVFYLVAPLCPKESAIFHQFGNNLSGFKLHGLGDGRWNDCVSYIDYRGVRALSLAAGDNIFAIGQKTGQIKLYHSATCQERITLNHGEPVKFLKFDNSGQRLLASGNRLLNMFNVDGDLVWTFSHLDPVVTAAFSENDDFITVATKGSSVIYFSAQDGRLLPGEYLGRQGCRLLKGSTRQAILHADISPDMKMMAIAYRGRPVQLWSLERDVSIGTCWFKRDIPGKLCLSISEVLFNRNPAVELLAVASQDGELAIFDPWTQRELKSVSGEAYTLACTPEGRTLATGDMLGSIKLWDFDTLTLLYCIKSDDFEVRSLAFSGDGLRLYDIRDAKTKVWEPSALVRKSLSDESSISESIALPPTVVDRGQEATEITNIATMGDEQCVLVGRGDGTVVLFDMRGPKLQENLYAYQHSLLVTQVCWSPGGYIATADASSVVQVWAVGKGADEMMEARVKLLEAEFLGPIQSIAISPSGSELLVCAASSDSIYRISKVENEIASKISSCEDLKPSSRAWAWLPEPLAGADIALVSDAIIHLFQVPEIAGDLILKAKAILTYGGNPLLLVVRKLVFASASKFLVVELEPKRGVSSQKLLVYCLAYLADELPTSPDDLYFSLKPLLCLDDKMIRIIIGWHGNVLVFLDTDLWICSIDMASVKSGERTVYTRTRHLFIPYELVGSNNGVAPVLVAGTSIVFPREGSVTIIEDALSSAFISDEITV
ncbi:hypothetical protein HD806DRAFT_537878 [Xylariaceae sp. AK1471]|nr:hypothetical protein HD806DRAFT_537878 [Xylariaceae sp. AK1471]